MPLLYHRARALGWADVAINMAAREVSFAQSVSPNSSLWYLSWQQKPIAITLIVIIVLTERH